MRFDIRYSAGPYERKLSLSFRNAANVLGPNEGIGCTFLCNRRRDRHFRICAQGLDLGEASRNLGVSGFRISREECVRQRIFMRAI